jgi:hypothetical protein
MQDRRRLHPAVHLLRTEAIPQVAVHPVRPRLASSVRRAGSPGLGDAIATAHEASSTASIRLPGASPRKRSAPLRIRRAGLPSDSAGYAAAVGLLVDLWKSSRLYNWLRLKGYVAFDLPCTVTTLGGLLLMGMVAAHVYVVTTEVALPLYFKVYCAVLIAGCFFAAVCDVVSSESPCASTQLVCR